MADETTDDSTTSTPTPASDATTAATTTPVAPHVATATETLISHLKDAGVAELEAAKPLIGQIVRQFVASYEAKLSGVSGFFQRRVIDSIVDAIFGPAPLK